MNKWMNNVTYLAAMAHIGWAALILLTAAFFLSTAFQLLGITTLFVMYAGVKEYWYDAHYELPVQTFKENTQDFMGYLGGLALGWIVLLIRIKLGYTCLVM
jgi:hypothetical protein